MTVKVRVHLTSLTTRALFSTYCCGKTLAKSNILCDCSKMTGYLSKIIGKYDNILQYESASAPRCFIMGNQSSGSLIPIPILGRPVSCQIDWAYAAPDHLLEEDAERVGERGRRES